jgi:hypothetical protein
VCVCVCGWVGGGEGGSSAPARAAGARVLPSWRRHPPHTPFKGRIRAPTDSLKVGSARRSLRRRDQRLPTVQRARLVGPPEPILYAGRQHRSSDWVQLGRKPARLLGLQRGPSFPPERPTRPTRRPSPQTALPAACHQRSVDECPRPLIRHGLAVQCSGQAPPVCASHPAAGGMGRETSRPRGPACMKN